MRLPVVSTWEEWRPIFTDADLWEPVVRRICQEEQLAEPETVEVGFPGSCAVFLVDRALVVKIYPPMCRHDFEREGELYRLLSGRSDLPLPHLLAAGTYHDRIDWPYIITEFRPGVAIREVRGRIEPSNMVRIAETLGRTVKAFHATPVIPAPNRWSSV